MTLCVHSIPEFLHGYGTGSVCGDENDELLWWMLVSVIWKVGRAQKVASDSGYFPIGEFKCSFQLGQPFRRLTRFLIALFNHETAKLRIDNGVERNDWRFPFPVGLHLEMRFNLHAKIPNPHQNASPSLCSHNRNNRLFFGIIIIDYDYEEDNYNRLYI